MASRCEVNYERMVGIKARTKPQIFSFTWLLPCQKGNTAFRSQTIEMTSKEEDRRGRRRVGTLIINATGHRPFLNL